jgi:hypothetical protein
LPWPSTPDPAFPCWPRARRAQGAACGRCAATRSPQPRLRSCPSWSWLRKALGSWWALRQICVSRRDERCDEEGVSIDTICTHSFSPSIQTISSACSSLHSALEAVVLVLAHLQLHLQLHHAQQPRESHNSSLTAGTPGQCMTWDQSSVDLQSYSRTNLNRATNGFATAVSRVLLGGKRQTQALSAVSHRDLSGKLTWCAHRRITEFCSKVKTPRSPYKRIPSCMEPVSILISIGTSAVGSAQY